MVQGHNYFPFLLKDLVQRRSGLCLLLLLLKYLGCWLAPSPRGFCILLSHYPIVTLQPLTPSDTQGCALLTKFPALIHFILPFPVQRLGQKLLLSSVTSFASLGILFIFICFPSLYVFPCLSVGSVTGQEAARHFYHAHVSNWDLPVLAQDWLGIQPFQLLLSLPPALGDPSPLKLLSVCSAILESGAALCWCSFSAS